MNTPATASDIRVVASLAEIETQQWNRLAGQPPFLRHEFLRALEETGCVGGRSGWQPQFLTAWEDGALAAAMPLYLKHHSYGEYVFDWAWADAYQRHGLRYYPKLVNAVPFTPVTGQRVLGSSPELRARLIAAALELGKKLGVSSFHCLFPPPEQAQEFQAQGMMLRTGVQFHWQNPGYGNFDDYLAALTRDKRKKIKQERRRVNDAGITFRCLTGHAIGETDWRFFNRCYQNTYQEHFSTPYLNLEFFLQIGWRMPDNVVLIMADRDGSPIASALNFRDESNLYGRYWGALEKSPGLHFETCYYQAIQYCIQHKIATFEGGAQGEHKVARGFMPVKTWSAHWLAHPEFARAVEEFLARESQGIDHYVNELQDNSPFKER